MLHYLLAKKEASHTVEITKWILLNTGTENEANSKKLRLVVGPEGHGGWDLRGTVAECCELEAFPRPEGKCGRYSKQFQMYAKAEHTER